MLESEEEEEEKAGEEEEEERWRSNIMPKQIGVSTIVVSFVAKRDGKRKLN